MFVQSTPIVVQLQQINCPVLSFIEYVFLTVLKLTKKSKLRLLELYSSAYYYYYYYYYHIYFKGLSTGGRLFEARVQFDVECVDQWKIIHIF